MSDDQAAAFVGRAVIERSASVLLAGPPEAARPLLRAWVLALGAEQALHVVALCAADAPWEAGPQAGRSLVSSRVCGPECTPDQATRAALRSDPDLIVSEPGATPGLGLLLTCAETGHQVLAHVPGGLDEAAASCPLPLGLAFHLGVEVDAQGVARLLRLAGPGGPDEVLWDRARPGPLPAELPGRAPPPPPPPEPPPEPLPAGLVDQARRALEGRLRPAWRPRLGPAGADPTRSRLGGRPMLAPGEGWPGCPSCGLALPLALQLRREELPPEAAARFPSGAGWLQLFYCDSAGCAVRDPAGPAAANRLLRWLAAAGARPGEPPAPLGDEAGRRWEPADVLGWEPLREAPHEEDLGELSEEARQACRAVSEQVEARTQARRDGQALLPEEIDDDLLEALAGARQGDKLLGWPCWEQAAEWTACARCGRRRELLFQLDAWRGHLTALFAADGLGHVSACPEHPHELAFAWGCG